MGADSRATAGNIIADKHCEKVHKLTDSIYACGAGTAADLDQVLCSTFFASKLFNWPLFHVTIMLVITGRFSKCVDTLCGSVIFFFR